MRSTIVFIALSLLCSACFKPIYDSYLEYGPGIKASATEAEVGEPVEITLSGGFQLPSTSAMPDAAIPDFVLSACFSDSDCQGKLLLPSSVSVLNGGTYSKDIKGLVVERGGSVEIMHSFTFTSSEPQILSISAVYQSVDANGEPQTYSESKSVEVTFK